MTNQLLLSLNSWLIAGTIAGYVLATLLYVPSFVSAKTTDKVRFAKAGRWAANAHLVGVICHATAIIVRWQASGFWPTSNMYEFIGFMAFTCMLAFQVINRMYQIPLVGAVVSPLGLFLIGYSYVFPPKVTPLIPALQSYWLTLHVSTVALGEGFFAVAFGAALLYLLRIRGLELAAEAATSGEVAAAATVGMTAPSGKAHTVDSKQQRFERIWGHRGLELLFYLIFVLVGFTLLALVFRWSGFQWLFDNSTYHLPPIIGPSGAEIGSKEFLGIPLPLFSVPSHWRGKNLNTLLYSLVFGWMLFAFIRRFVTRGRISDFLARRVGGDPETLDEVSYRAVAIGYPLFTLGALIFAMIWAKEAWGSYWFWDPKETWALITWLAYSAYLHFRVTKGWAGRKSAWMAVLGFGVVLFTLVGVNLLIVGYHSYAGGDM